MSEVATSSQSSGFFTNLAGAFNSAYDAGRKKYNEYAQKYRDYARQEAEHKAKIKRYYDERLRIERMEQARLRNDKDRAKAERQAKWDAKPTGEKLKEVGKLGVGVVKPE